MSGFQKKALLKQASKLGLEPVAEIPSASKSSESEETEGSQGEFNIQSSVQTVHEKNILSTVFQATKSVFPVQETYHDSESGLAFQTYYAPAKSINAPLFVCHHGAGSSAMSFWNLAQKLQQSGPSDEVPGIFAFTARGHFGSTETVPMSFKLEDFTRDFRFVLQEFITRQNPENTICLVGHSLGGAVLTDFVYRYPDTPYKIKALVVVDIVEETAVKSLMQMAIFLNKRPKSFITYAQAIQWHLQSRMLRNEESARVSVPDLLVQMPGGTLTWKCNLHEMASFWDTWFVDLSPKFINCNFDNCKLTKLLILSTNETLDKALTIGSMQGKFQLIVFNNSTNAGHFLHEDIPQQVSIKLMDFMRRLNTASTHNSHKNITPLWGGKINS